MCQKKPPELSPREQQTLQLLAGGLSFKQTAAEMKISVSTVKYYVGRARCKLETQNTISACVKAALYGLIELPAPNF